MVSYFYYRIIVGVEIIVAPAPRSATLTLTSREPGTFRRHEYVHLIPGPGLPESKARATLMVSVLFYVCSPSEVVLRVIFHRFRETNDLLKKRILPVQQKEGNWCELGIPGNACFWLVLLSKVVRVCCLYFYLTTCGPEGLGSSPAAAEATAVCLYK